MCGGGGQSRTAAWERRESEWRRQREHPRGRRGRMRAGEVARRRRRGGATRSGRRRRVGTLGGGREGARSSNRSNGGTGSRKRQAPMKRRKRRKSRRGVAIFQREVGAVRALDEAGGGVDGLPPLARKLSNHHGRWSSGRDKVRSCGRLRERAARGRGDCEPAGRTGKPRLTRSAAIASLSECREPTEGGLDPKWPRRSSALCHHGWRREQRESIAASLQPKRDVG